MKIKLNLELGRKLIYFQIIYNLVIKFFITVLGFPYFLNYLSDAVTILLIAVIWKKTRKVIRQSNYNSFIYVTSVFFAVVSISALFNFVPPLLYIWAVRNTFRFIIFMAACIVCLKHKDVDNIFQILFIFQFVNIAACIYEYLVLGCSQDYLGGIFGIEQGCNAALNLYFCIVLAWTLAQYLEKNINILFLTVSIASTVIISAFAELKFFYIEFVIIVSLIVLISKPSFKTFIIIAGSIVAFIVSLNYLRELFPAQYAVLESREAMLTYFNSTGGGYNISRMRAFQDINNRFFHDSIWHNLFGLGFGNCESSSIEVFTSDFYRSNHSLNYRFFDHVMVFLETGYVGFVAYILVFVNAARHAVVNRKKIKDKSYWSVVLVLCICCIMNMWYNYALKIEYSFMIYFAVCSVAILMKPEPTNEEKA